MSDGPTLVDLHSHLVPGVDDGADTLEEALEAIRRMADQGVGAIVTTPHIDASLIARRAPFKREQHLVEERWAEVVAAARERHPALRFGLGREIMLDTPVFELDDPGLRLVGGPYVLFEFPRLNIPPGSAEALGRIRSSGFRPIVAHVERYHYDGDPRTTIGQWRDGGAALQVNHASLLGSYGAAAAELAWRLLGRGWADLVASDHHGHGRPRIAEARDAVVERAGEELWRLLGETNPRRVLTGESLAPAPKVELPPVGPGPLRRWFRRMLGPPATAEW